MDNILEMTPTARASSDFIKATRTKCFPDINTKLLLHYAFESKNRFLYILTYQFEKLANELGIKSSNGVANFIYEMCRPIDLVLGEYFMKLGSLNKVDTGTIIEIFRSEAWNFRKHNEGFTYLYLGKDYFSNINKSKQS